MADIYNEPPYYDTYSDEKSKGYDKLVFNPGRVLQSREANVIQSLLQDQLKGLGDTIYSNGTPLTGLDIHFDSTKKLAYLSAGSVYINGEIVQTGSTTVPLQGVGEETINVRAVNTLVKDQDSFKDPAVGYENEGKYGADRNAISLSFVANDPNSALVYRLIDGQVVQTNKNDQVRQLIKDALADRTYKESGNYRVSGLQVSQPANYDQSDTNRIKLKLSSGNASILGYDVTKRSDSQFYVDRTKAESNVINEVKQYKDGSLKYLLNNSRVDKLNRVLIQTKLTKIITRGSTTGGSDQLVSDTTTQSVLSILTVSDSTKTYTEDTDYTLNTNNSSISWDNKGGSQPFTGSSYTVSMVISEVVPTSQYSLDNEDTSSYLIFDQNFDKPYIDNETYLGKFTVEYTFLLSRIDEILINDEGLIVVNKGIPAINSNLLAPSYSKSDLLSLATVLVSPNTSNVTITNSTRNRLTMDDLYNMYLSLNSLQSNLAITNLDREAKDGEDATLLSGIFTDGFLNTNKADLSHDDFHGSYDVTTNEFTTGTNPVYNDLTIDDKNKNNSYASFGGYLTPPYTEVKTMIQGNATDTVQINEYNVFHTDGVLVLEPETDQWVDTADNEKHTIKNIYKTVYHRDWHMSGYDEGTTVSSNTKVVDNTVEDEIETTMRQIKVLVHGSNFTPDKDNYSASFGDSSIKLSPEGSSLPGTEDGTIRTDTSGNFEASFMVPANYPSGDAMITVSNDSSSGSTIYHSQGIKRTTTYITETTRTYTHTISMDPVAETFSVDSSCLLRKLHLYFSSKDDNEPIIVQIKETDNHIPSDNVIGQAVVYPDDINISDDATAETTISLDDAVMLDPDTDYAIVVLSNSNSYNIYVATLGRPLLGSNGVKQVSQPYSQGTLFTSANGNVWTESQVSDLKFGITTSQYTEDGRVVFSNIHSDDGFNRIMPLISSAKDSNGITYQYSTDKGASWSDVTPWNSFNLSSQANDVMIQVLIDKDSTDPILEWDNAGLVTYLDDNSFSYVSRNVTYDTAYTGVKVVLISNYDSDTSLIEGHVYYANDTDGKTWIELPQTSKKVSDANADNLSYEYTFEASKLASGKNFRVKVTEQGSETRPWMAALRTVTKI